MIKNIFFILLLTANAVHAQTNIVSIFSGNQLNQTVYLEFTITAGQTCNGINIERSNDSLSFYKIGDIAGSCGSSTEPVSYSYTDSFPLHNTYNFYRLAPGNADWSEVIKIYFNLHDKKEFLIHPNPFITTAKISYQNPLSKTIHWKMFDTNGKQVRNGTTKEESFIISKNSLHSGLYFLQLILDNKDFQKAKLIIE